MPQLGGDGAGPVGGPRPVRKIVAWVLIAISAYYLFRVMADGYAGLLQANVSVNAVEFSWLVVGILGTLGLSAVYHVLAVRRIEAHDVPATQIALAYALSQVMRYIPGRVFGLLFQVKYLSGRIRATTIGMALLVQTAFDYIWAAIFLGAILVAYRLESPWPMALLIPALFLVWVSHQRGWIEQGLASPWLLHRFLSTDQVALLRQPPNALASTLVLGLVWVPISVGIAVALADRFGFMPAMVLGSLYLVSAVLSLLVFVVPSGLFVREAIFVWLGDRYGFPTSTVIVLGLLLRVAMTASEVLLVAVCFAVNSSQSYVHSDKHSE